MRFFFALPSFVALAAAYSISSPGGSAGWSTAGPNAVTWSRVNTDPLNFTVVLSNQASSPSYSQVLNALVNGTLGNITVSPPSTGFPTGSGFQVNFVQDTDHLTTILAQSQQFEITQSNTTSTTTPTPATFATTNPTATTGIGTDTNDLNPSSTTTPSNGADRTKAAGGVGLIFGVLAAMIL